MSNAVAVYQQINDKVAFLKWLGESIALSKFFGCETIHQGNVLAMECAARGVTPLSLQEQYHIIFGKLSMRADAMLAGIYRHGGRHKVVERTADKATVSLFKDGEWKTYTFTWTEAQAEPFIYEGKDSVVLEQLQKGQKPKLKTKYATPRARMQMLWARCVSDAVRAEFSQVNAGVYTPEENGGVDDCEGGAPDVVEGEFELTSASSATSPPSEEPPFATEPGSGPAAGATDAQPEELTALAPRATETQIAQIRTQFKHLGWGRQEQLHAIENYAVNTLAALSQTDAQELIQKLGAKLTAAQQTMQQQTMSSDGPCTPEQEGEIRRLVSEINQSKPGASKEFKDKFKATGLERLSQLTRPQAEALLARLKQKNITAFFEMDLQRAPGSAESVKNG